MNKITLDFYLAKSKKTINGLLVLFVLLLSTQVSWGQVAQFDFPASSSLVVSTKDANVTVSNMALSAGTIGTNITTGTYFLNEPYIEGSGGWTATSQASAKNFTFTVTAASGYVFSITNISFKGYATSAGPSAFGFAIGSTDIYSVDAPSASVVSVNQSVSSQTGLTTATIKIQGWLNGSRTSNGTGVFRLDDVVVSGIVTPTVVSAPVINNSSFTASTTVLAENTSIYTVTATNTPSSFSATGLPTGLSINPTTGVISGTPATGTAALSPYTVVLMASNSGGDSATENLTLTINKANQTITFTPTLSTKVIGDTPVTLTATSTSGLTVSYATSDSGVASLSGSTLSFVGAGTATITASQAGNVDYNVATSVTQDQLVSAAPLSNQTITFGALSPVTYGDTFELTATSDSSLPVTYTSSNPAVATVSGSTVTILGAGSTNITASQAGNGSFNPAADVIQSLTVNQKALTIPDAAATSKAYNGLLTTNITGTLTGIINSDDVTFNGTLKGTFADANVANGIAVTSNCTLAGTKAGNYTLTQPTGLTANITQASQTITFGALTNKTTVDSPFALLATAGSALAVTYVSSNTAVATVSGSTVTIVGAGSTTFTASQIGDANYAAATPVDQVLLVNPVVYLNQFTGIAACPTNGNLPSVLTNVSGTSLTRNTITCTTLLNQFNSTTLNNSASVNDASFIEFSATAVSGYRLNLTSLSFYRQGSGTAPNSLEVRYSTDGFATSTSWGAAPATPTSGTVATWDFADFSSANAGTVTFRIYPYGTQRADLTGTAAASTGTFRLDDITINGNVTAVTTWNGTTWSNGAPTASVDAIIAGDYSVAANITAKTLTVNNNAVVTIPSGNNVTVTGAVTVTAPAALTFSNNANLIQGGTTNTNTGNVIVKRNSSLLKRLDYTLWSSPVTNAALFLKAFSPNTLDARFYTYNTTFNTGGVNGAFSLVTSPSTTNFLAGKGYSIRMPDNASAETPTAYPAEFTGVPNNGDITASLVDGGSAGLRYNLVGNPYPSPISMSTFVTDNTSNIESTLYFWRKTNGSGSAYCTWVPGGGSGTFVTNGNSKAVNPSGIIQTGQGFFVEAKSGATSLIFKNTQRVTNNTGQFFKTKQVAEASKIWLNATNAKGDFSQMAITYFAEATSGVDAFDAKYFNDSPIALTSNINNGEYTIQGRPAFDPTDVVALNFKTNADGDYTIALDHFEGVFTAGQEVYLVDSKTGTETDLKAGAYTFNATSGIDNTRFSLKYQKTLKVDAPAFNENSVSVYKNNGALYVNSGFVAMSNIKVFDIQGRLIAEQKNLKSTTAVFNNLRAKNQVLIVKITGANNNVVSKKIVN